MKASLLFILLLSISFSPIVRGQELKDSEPSPPLISSVVKREVVSRILIFKFKPSNGQKVIYLAKGDIDSSWLPKIPNVEFRLLSDKEVEDRETGVYFFTEPELTRKTYSISFAFGDPRCGYTGGGWDFRIAKNRLRLWYVGEVGGGCSGGGGRNFKTVGKLNTYPNELQGYSFFGKGKLKGLEVTVSTREDVKKNFGSDCESGCDYNNDWSVDFSYFGTMTKEITVDEKKIEYVPKEEYIGKVYSIRLIPKKPVSFSQITFSNKFNHGNGFSVGDGFDSKGNFTGAAGTSYDSYEDRYGLEYTIFQSGYTIGTAEKTKHSKGNLIEIKYSILNHFEETMFIEQK